MCDGCQQVKRLSCQELLNTLFHGMHLSMSIRDDHDVAADNAWENGTANPVNGVTYANRRCHGVQVSCCNHITYVGAARARQLQTERQR